MSDPLLTLLDSLFTPDDAPEIALLDRSTAERYTACPCQAANIERGIVSDNSLPADAGTEDHRVISEGIDLYVSEHIPPRDYMEQEIVKARPDVAREAISGLRRSSWGIDRFLTARHPNDIIAYQGGQVDWVNPETNETRSRSGQLAWDILAGIRLTSEIDLLVAGATAVELCEIDWKTGRKHWNSDDVLASFQFNLHAWLVFKNFPDCELLHVTVWMTRFNQQTPRVTFTRKMAVDFEATLLQAVEYRRQALEDVEHAECWPAPERCELCAAVWICPVVKEPVTEFAGDPVAFVRETTKLDALVAKRKSLLRAYVDEHCDIVSEDGDLAFGLDEKPIRKPKSDSYRFYTPKDYEPEAPDETPSDPHLAAIHDGLKGKDHGTN